MMRRLLFILLFIPTVLCGQDMWFVSPAPTGNDSSGDGSSEAPWATISKAFSESTAGDVVYMTAGTYTISSQVTLPTGVSLHGIGTVRIEATYGATGQALLKGESSSGWAHPTIAGNQYIRGITFDGNSTCYAAIDINFRHNVKIYDCRFEKFVDHGVKFWGQSNWNWGGTNPYEDGDAPDAWCTGNEIYNCTFIDNAQYTSSGSGNIEYGQQDGLKIYNNTIDQTASSGYGITFADMGWSKNTEIYDNYIEVAWRTSSNYNFAIENWYDLGGVKIYDNTLIGHLDFTVAGDEISAGYSVWLHDNIIGFNSQPDHTEYGVSLEGYVEDFIISNNEIKNVAVGIAIAMIWPQTLHPDYSYFKNINIYNNLIYDIGIDGDGWTYGEIGGIRFEGQNSGNTVDDFFIYHNVIVSSGNFHDNTYDAYGIRIPCVATTSDFHIRNNIIVGFDGAYSRNAPVYGWGTTTNANLEIDHNVFYGNGNLNEPLFTSGRHGEGTYEPDPSYTESSNVRQNPDFVSTSDFHLTEESPAIGAGTNVGLTTDYDGVTWANPPSIGAYEYVSESGSAPVVEFSGSPTTVIVDHSVSFTDMSSNAPTGWSWAFGDEGTSSSKNPVHTYTETGSFSVSLTASNDYGSDTETKAGYITVITESSANIHYVSTYGDNGNDGSEAYPWATLSYACTQVTTPGHTIFVKNGTYNESSRCSVAPGVIIRGESRAATIINLTYQATGSSDAALYLYSSSLTDGDQSISDLTLHGSNLTGIRAILVMYRYNVELYNLTIEDFSATGVHFRNQINWMTPPVTYATGNSIHDCIINNCSDKYLDSYASGNLRADGQEGLTIYNCIFNNTFREQGHNGNTLNFTNNKDVKLYNCVFYKPDDEGSQWNFFTEIFHCQGGIEIYNCEFYGTASLDVSNAYNGASVKGVYDYAFSIHDNYFITNTGDNAPEPEDHHQGTITIEKGDLEYVYIYNNHIKCTPIGIVISTATNGDQIIDHVYIYNNILEDIGYSDYAPCYGIWFGIEATSYSVIIDNVHIWNNVISGDGANYGIYWNFDGATSNCSVINNIILDFNLYPILLRQQPSQTTYFNDSEIIYNCFYGNGTDEIAVSGTINQSGNDLSTGNITLNPLLTSSLALSSISSPAYHTGISVGLSTDYEGKAWNNPPSMGAIELIDDTEPPEPPVVVWKRARKGGRYITKQGKYVMMRE